MQTNRLDKALQIRAMINDLGDYDCSFVGAIGEIYAEEKLGMIKAERHTSNIDGHINGRAVQVKSRNLPGRAAAHYVAIRNGKWEGVDDLVVVILDGDDLFHYQEPLEGLKYYQTKVERRYYFKDFKNAKATQ